MIHRYFDDIRRRRLGLVLRKSWIFVSLCLAVVPLVIVRILRPLIVIRFGELSSIRIARYIGEPEVYLSELDVGMHRGRYVDVFYRKGYVCNYQLKKMWDRKLRVVQLAKPVGLLNRLIPAGKSHCVPWRIDQERDFYGILPRTKPHLEFTQDEEQAGRVGLRAMGVPDGAPFICFHARDSAYEVAQGADVDEERATPSNADIRSYLPAVEEMTRRGFYALRMGAIVEEPLASDNPMVIDYATKARTELLDLYLCANCEFFIGSTVGITGIPMAFRRPTIHANFVSVSNTFDWITTWQPHDLWIPKKLWLSNEQRFITIREILQSAGGVFAERWWDPHTGIKVVDNTVEEITAVVIEMEARLKGIWQSTKEDEELQRQFWRLYDPTRFDQRPRARIGADFLRTHPDLLD